MTNNERNGEMGSGDNLCVGKRSLEFLIMLLIYLSVGLIQLNIREVIHLFEL